MFKYKKELKALLEGDKKCRAAMKERDDFLKTHEYLCNDHFNDSYEDIKKFLIKADIKFYEKSFVTWLNITYTYEGFIHYYNDLYKAPEKYDNYLFLVNGDKNYNAAVYQAYKKYCKNKEKRRAELIKAKANKILEKVYNKESKVVEL